MIKAEGTMTQTCHTSKHYPEGKRVWVTERQNTFVLTFDTKAPWIEQKISFQVLTMIEDDLFSVLI